jgi:glycosyltransferase involved in cell wall biosynthesis
VTGAVAPVSVVVPVRDGEMYLADALRSILDQVPAPAEVIVVDDGSGDASRAVAGAFGPAVQVVSQPALGIGAARNRGVQRATARLLGFLDADDRWAPRSLGSRVARLEGDDAPDIVWGRVRHFASPEVAAGGAGQGVLPEEAPAHLAGGMLVTRSAFDRVGPFREDLSMGEFVDWVARARHLGLREGSVDEVVLWRRVHGANHTLVHGGDRADLARVLKAALDRRRPSKDVAG